MFINIQPLQYGSSREKVYFKASQQYYQLIASIYRPQSKGLKRLSNCALMHIGLYDNGNVVDYSQIHQILDTNCICDQ